MKRVYRKNEILWLFWICPRERKRKHSPDFFLEFSTSENPRNTVAFLVLPNYIDWQCFRKCQGQLPPLSTVEKVATLSFFKELSLLLSRRFQPISVNFFFPRVEHGLTSEWGFLKYPKIHGNNMFTLGFGLQGSFQFIETLITSTSSTEHYISIYRLK